jgi:hypothetical protein
MQENKRREIQTGQKDVWTAKKGEEGMISLFIFI